MIVWNKVTWYSKLAAAIFFLGVFPALVFYLGREVALTETIVRQENHFQKVNKESLIDLEGISPTSIMNAPVPLKVLEDSGSSEEVDFDNGQASKKDEEIGGYIYWASIEILGYAKMEGVSTAVTLVQVNTGGTGYFPYIVLYQNKPQNPADSRSMSVPVQVVRLNADRIFIHSLLIKNDSVKMTLSSWGSDEIESIDLKYKNGSLQ